MLRSASLVLLLLALAVSASAAQAGGSPPVARAAATCADYSTQAEAQRAADTRDADGDGIYCESLPCPCSSSSGGGSEPEPAPAPEPAKPSCQKPKDVQRITFSKTKYRNIREHYIAAVGKGWPRILVVNRPQADARRDRLLEDYETRDGLDRDEYPPAVGRGRGKGLEKGANPRGWKAHVEYVDSFGEPIAWLPAWREAQALLQRHQVPLHLLLILTRLGWARGSAWRPTMVLMCSRSRRAERCAGGDRSRARRTARSV